MNANATGAMRAPDNREAKHPLSPAEQPEEDESLDVLVPDDTIEVTVLPLQKNIEGKNRSMKCIIQRSV